MRRKQLILQVASVCALLAWWAARGNATTIDFDAILTFEEAVVLADFVGTVECVTAGGLVAK